MSQKQVSQFESYQLTEEELIEGAKLTISQKEVIHNHRTELADQLVNLACDATSPQGLHMFLREQGYLQGQIAAYSWLLEASKVAEATEKY